MNLTRPGHLIALKRFSFLFPSVLFLFFYFPSILDSQRALYRPFSVAITSVLLLRLFLCLFLSSPLMLSFPFLSSILLEPFSSLFHFFLPRFRHTYWPRPGDSSYHYRLSHLLSFHLLFSFLFITAITTLFSSPIHFSTLMLTTEEQFTTQSFRIIFIHFTAANQNEVINEKIKVST